MAHMEIERAGAVVAVVRKAMVSRIHHRFVVDLTAGGELEAHGDLVAKEFGPPAQVRPAACLAYRYFAVRYLAFRSGG